MNYFELRCIAYIKKDIAYKNSFNLISKYINFSMSQDEKLKDLHKKENIFKNYSFGSFYPIEKDKIYKKGGTYSFTIRSLDEEFILKLQKYLRENVNNSFFQVIETIKKRVNRFFISELYTITPTIVTVKDQNNKSLFWTTQKDGDILKLQKQLQDNLLRKYENYYGKKLDPSQNFIQLIELKNQKPQSIYFEKKINEDKHITVRLLGNKFKIVPNEDEISQKLAFIVLACGLGEKQSLGGGFCLGKGIR